MRNVNLKVCGMRDPGNILEVASLAPDYMGFIFYDASPRYVGADFAMPDFFPESILKVGVFVNAPTKEIVSVVRKHGLDLVQLHGNESPDQCSQLKDNNMGVIKVFSVDDATDFNEVKAYSKVVDYFLFDTKGKFYGGNAKRFDWRVLSRYDQDVPFFLSGGISPENSGEVLELEGFNLWAIDVNSGVEAGPAIKDTKKITAIQKILKSKT